MQSSGGKQQQIKGGGKSEKRWNQRWGGGLKIDSGDEIAKRNEGEEIWNTHTYSLINISGNVAPWWITLLIITKRSRYAAFLIRCQSFSGHTVICSVKRKERRKKTRCVAHESAGSVCIGGALMYGPGQSDKRGESWLGWLKSPCWHLCRNPWGKKEKPRLFEGSVPAFPRPLPPYRLSLPMSAQCIKTCPPQNKDPLKKENFIRGKTITPSWSHRFRGYWRPSNFSTSALQICPPVTVHRAAGLHGAPAAWPSLNYLTSGHIILRLFIDSIPSRSISSLPAVFETAPPMLLL